MEDFKYEWGTIGGEQDQRENGTNCVTGDYYIMYIMKGVNMTGDRYEWKKN